MTTIRTEAGMGGRLGRSNMAHFDLAHVVKTQARIVRRRNDRIIADLQCMDAALAADHKPLVRYVPANEVDMVCFLDDDQIEHEVLIDSFAPDEASTTEFTGSGLSSLWDEVDHEFGELDFDSDDTPSFNPYGDTLELRGNTEEFLANDGFIVTTGKWYC